MKPSSKLVAMLIVAANDMDMENECRVLEKLEKRLLTPEPLTHREYNTFIWAWRRVMHAIELRLIESVGKMRRYEEQSA